ncbi:hypothetical protein [Thalassoglobus sp.]|uniref:hypothetical protein n=1 Tax=Thalassoglobus sp. TaxID=2795869 RepID=UPI003AA8CE6C
MKSLRNAVHYGLAAQLPPETDPFRAFQIIQIQPFGSVQVPLVVTTRLPALLWQAAPTVFKKEYHPTPCANRIRNLENQVEKACSKAFSRSLRE